MIIKRIEDCGEKQKIARRILEALPAWFGIDEARETYIKESADQLFLAALDGNQATGFLCLKETGKDTLELSVMGVLREYHRRGIGKQLFLNAKKLAMEKGYAFLQVKTVQTGRCEEYDNTNRFYRSLGFQEFEVFPTLWGEGNPCQTYIMSLRQIPICRGIKIR